MEVDANNGSQPSVASETTNGLGVTSSENAPQSLEPWNDIILDDEDWDEAGAEMFLRNCADEYDPYANYTPEELEELGIQPPDESLPEMDIIIENECIM